MVSNKMPTAVSAPGKVLLAGGYLVLDRAYTALVFGLSARIHVVVQDIDQNAEQSILEIMVQSPQFRDAEWRYGCHINEATKTVDVTQLQGSSLLYVSRNPFVETALSYAVAYISAVMGSITTRPALVTILADSDYYSQPGELPPSQIHTSRFLDFGVRLQDAHKTGLGSSAALVTAFTGAMLSHYLSESQFSLSSSRSHAILHNLAQAAHCAAQGKVGSGFDVAAAVYGSCLYRRFSPAILSALDEPASASFSERLRYLVEDMNAWDTKTEKNAVQIPQGMALVMCDVDCGSQTVSMVKKVLEWRQHNQPSAKLLWDQLQAENELLARRLLSGVPGELVKSILAIRKYARDMGVQSGVPIEPPEQTLLLDALTDSVKGVFGGVVPGAGGYDAIVLLVKDDEATLAGLNAFLQDWSSSNGSNVKLLSVKGDMEGVRKEAHDLYEDWIK